MKGIRVLPVLAAWTALLCATDVQAYRMIQNTATVRTSTGFRVRCDDPGGFAHRPQSSVAWRLNPANQGGKAGVLAAFQNALASWTAVTPAGYALGYDGSTAAGFVTDNVNTALWASGNGCTGGCLAITALVLGPGQAIGEADISFNNDYDWNTNGASYDVEAIAAHELGHTMGIHHTEIARPRNRPTMYASYFGTDGRTLETDDRDALNCAYNRYPPTAAAGEVASASARPAPAPRGVRLASRTLAGQATLRYAVDRPGPVRLEIFDVAGRRVATLVDGPRGSGEHEVAWDGRTDSGSARRGIYYARIETPQGRGGAAILIGP